MQGLSSRTAAERCQASRRHCTMTRYKFVADVGPCRLGHAAVRRTSKQRRYYLDEDEEKEKEVRERRPLRRPPNRRPSPNKKTFNTLAELANFCRRRQRAARADNKHR